MKIIKDRIDRAGYSLYGLLSALVDIDLDLYRKVGQPTDQQIRLASLGVEVQIK
jgi:hypothetical protein